MHNEGPSLELLLRRLAECPLEFLQVEGSGPTAINATAVVCDVLRRLTPEKPPEQFWNGLNSFRGYDSARQSLAVLAAYLLADEWFLAQPPLMPAIYQLLESSSLANLARLVKSERFVRDADRREEFVRTCLRLLKLRPLGESEAVAADRLNSLDSVERNRVLQATAKAERRAREVREAMVRKQAQEAASRYGE